MRSNVLHTFDSFNEDGNAAVKYINRFEREKLAITSILHLTKNTQSRSIELSFPLPFFFSFLSAPSIKSPRRVLRSQCIVSVGQKEKIIKITDMEYGL